MNDTKNNMVKEDCHLPMPCDGAPTRIGKREFEGCIYRAVDGVELYYRDYKPSKTVGIEKTPIICLPGLTRNSRDFHDFASLLEPDRRVICPDYRGRGKSARCEDWRLYTAPQLISDISALLTLFDIHRVIFMGVSMGGLLSMALNVMRPRLTAGVVLNDIGPEFAEGGSGRIMEGAGVDMPQPDWKAAIEFCKSHYTQLQKRYTEHDWERLTYGTFMCGDDGILHYSWDVNLVKALMQDKGETKLWPLFKALKDVKTLSFRGELSDLFSAETFDKMAEVKPDLRRFTVDDVGHVPSIDWPECFAEIESFIAEIDVDEANS